MGFWSSLVAKVGIKEIPGADDRRAKMAKAMERHIVVTQSNYGGNYGPMLKDVQLTEQGQSTYDEQVGQRPALDPKTIQLTQQQASTHQNIVGSRDPWDPGSVTLTDPAEAAYLPTTGSRAARVTGGPTAPDYDSSPLVARSPTLTPSTPSSSQSTRKGDPQGLFNFRVEIEGLDVGGFRSVEGLEATVEIIEYHLGNQRMPMKRPGRPKVGNLRLSKGYVNTDTLWSWCENLMKGKVQRKSGSVVLLDDAGREVCRYNFFDAWPTKWSSFKLEGKGNDVMVEELELAMERIERA